ncbi:MAG: methyltransferase domain-containing protein [Candidatus Omnitrophota bacterium]
MIKLFANFLAYVLKLKLFLGRFNIGYTRTDLVLDIGSGDNPHPRADILLDLKLEDTDRIFTLLVDERPFLIADIEALPLKDKIVDFAICSHILEHINKPQKALQEICRIAKAGYIETPSETMQKICDVPAHKWFIKKDDNKLILERKKRPFYDADLALTVFKLWNDNDPYYKIWFYAFGGFLVRHYWKDNIDYEIFDFPESEICKEEFRQALRHEVKHPPQAYNVGRYIKKAIKCYYALTTLRRYRLKKVFHG